MDPEQESGDVLSEHFSRKKKNRRINSPAPAPQMQK